MNLSWAIFCFGIKGIKRKTNENTTLRTDLSDKFWRCGTSGFKLLKVHHRSFDSSLDRLYPDVLGQVSFDSNCGLKMRCDSAFATRVSRPQNNLPAAGYIFIIYSLLSAHFNRPAFMWPLFMLFFYYLSSALWLNQLIIQILCIAVVGFFSPHLCTFSSVLALWQASLLVFPIKAPFWHPWHAQPPIYTRYLKPTSSHQIMSSPVSKLYVVCHLHAPPASWFWNREEKYISFQSLQVTSIIITCAQGTMFSSKSTNQPKK